MVRFLYVVLPADVGSSVVTLVNGLVLVKITGFLGGKTFLAK